MFTKYSGIDVPKNYSGSRFKQNLETEMKTHKAPIIQPAPTVTKSSPQPSFQSIIDKAVSDEKETPSDYTEHTDAPSNEIPDPVSIIEPSREGDVDVPADRSYANSALSSLLESLNGDDLLLIALIILLSGNEGYENKEIIVTLALLLLYR